jgi:hypothetical protein
MAGCHYEVDYQKIGLIEVIVVPMSYQNIVYPTPHNYDIFGNELNIYS